jgi:hypothetical protein
LPELLGSARRHKPHATPSNAAARVAGLPSRGGPAPRTPRPRAAEAAAPARARTQLPPSTAAKPQAPSAVVWRSPYVLWCARPLAAAARAPRPAGAVPRAAPSAPPPRGSPPPRAPPWTRG